MVYRMLCFGLVFIPFYEIITTLFLPAQSIAFFDTRFPKECVAFTLALFIALAGLYTGRIKPIDNKWLFLFVGYLVVSLNKIPIVPVDLGGFDISNFWVWKPFMQILVFLFMLCVVCSMTWLPRTIEKVLTIMAWCGFIMAIYVFIQKLGLDQFFYVRSREVVMGTSVPALTGTMGSPAGVAPFLALCLVPAIYLKKTWFALSMSGAAFLTHSDMAVFSGIAGILIYLCARDFRKLAVMAFILVFTGLTCLFWTDASGKHLLNSNGRLGVWETMVKDLSYPMSEQDPRRFAMTGFGLGSFEHVYNMKHPTTSGFPPREAHNEYLELLWCVGIIGFLLFIAAFWNVLQPVYPLLAVHREYRCLFAMLITLCVCAAGTFIWHLAVYQFYTVVIVGMIYSILNLYKIEERSNRWERNQI